MSNTNIREQAAAVFSNQMLTDKPVKMKISIHEELAAVFANQNSRVKEAKALVESKQNEGMDEGIDAMLDIFYGVNQPTDEIIKSMLETVLQNIQKIKDPDMKLLAVNQLHLALIS